LRRSKTRGTLFAAKAFELHTNILLNFCLPSGVNKNNHFDLDHLKKSISASGDHI
jgi:hypothetical protein